MNPDRWQHVQTLFFNALKLAPDDQAAFLERECKDDAEAKAEVRALLAYRTKLGNFVDETAIEVLDKTYGREEPAGEPDDLIGTVIADRYIVSEFVDSGAMGSVYRGIHRLLGSPVAVKRIASRFRNRKEYRDRFVEEARKAARLNHENIAKVTDAVEQSGEIFIIMEFVEGATLRARLREPVSTAEFMDFASQCASALVAAHRERIVHLDLKPENIILTASGKVKICDFGVARQFPAEPAGETNASSDHWTFAGTPAYMAPEVMKSNRFDLRADIFSLGMVFYEILSGKHPFLSDDVATTTNRVMNETAPPLSQYGRKLPVRLMQLVERMMSKNPDDRPQSADEILRELHGIRRYQNATKDTLQTGREMFAWVAAKPLAASSIAVATVAAALVLMWAAHLWMTPIQQEVAVLRFNNVGDDPANQAFCDGLVETLTNKLSQLDHFQNAFRVKAASETRDITNARDARRMFGVAFVITGSVQRSGNSVRLTINVVEAATGTLLQGSTIDTELASLASLQDDIVIQIATLLHASPMQQDVRHALTSDATVAPVAYDIYVQGLGYLQRYEKVENVDKSIDLFQQVLVRDGKYALAYAALGEAYWRKYDLTKNVRFAEMGREYCQKALELNDRLAQVYVTLALISNGNGRYEDAVEQTKKSLGLNPVNGQAYRELAKAYQGLGKLDEAEQAYQQAIRQRGNDWGSYNQLGTFYYTHGRYAEAETQFRKVIELAPDNYRGYSNVGAVYQTTERFADAERMLQRSLEIRPNGMAYSNLGTLYYFHLRRPAEAARMFEKAIETGDADFQYTYWRNLAAAYYWSSGERPRARAAYEKTIELGEQQLLINPRNQPLLMQLADAYAMIDQAGRALEYMDKAQALSPLDTDSMAVAAGIYEKLGRRADAVRSIAMALCAGYSRELVDNAPGLSEVRSDPSFTAATNQDVVNQLRREKQCQNKM